MIIKLVHVLFQITDVMIFKKRKKRKKGKTVSFRKIASHT